MTGVQQRQSLARAIDGVEERIAAIRAKADTNKRPELGEEADAEQKRLEQLRVELENPSAEFQNIQRSFTEIIEDVNVMERKAGTASR
jgi:hypothetical protein